jgi:hypothetical protein
MALPFKTCNQEKMITRIRKKHFAVWLILLVLLPALVIITWLLSS